MTQATNTDIRERKNLTPITELNHITEEVEWRDVKGFEGFYQVSNTGEVRSLDRHNGVRIFKGRQLKPCKNNEGSPIVSLRGVGKRDSVVHQLVAQTFLPLIDGSTTIRHIDGDRTNNHVKNLEWVIRKVRQPKGRNRKLSTTQIAEIRELIDQGQLSLTAIADRYQVCLSLISRIKSKTRWKNQES